MEKGRTAELQQNPEMDAEIERIADLCTANPMYIHVSDSDARYRRTIQAYVERYHSRNYKVVPLLHMGTGFRIERKLILELS